MKKAILFDFDGTLANTLPLVIFSFQEVFRTYVSREFSGDDIIGMFGPTEEGLLKAMIPGGAYDEAASTFFRLYRERHADFVEDSQSIARVVRTLDEDGYKLGICTGKGRKTMDISAGFLSFCKYFDAIVTGDEMARPKPEPDGLFTCLQMLEVDPEDAVFVGDSNADMAAGRSAGLTTVGVKWMPITQSREFHPRPDYEFSDFDEFLQAIRSL